MKWHLLLTAIFLGSAIGAGALAEDNSGRVLTPSSAPFPSSAPVLTPMSLTPLAAQATTEPAGGLPTSFDDSLQAAKAYVAKHSDRYMDHNKLRRGMKGYGLTVMAGTEPQKFDIEVVSVMTRWGPHQDVVIAKLSGLDLEKIGLIAGMSGSPCYFRDDDGKDKLVGAVAFGWPWPKEPLCGIQPITQMLALSGFLEDKKPASQPTVIAAASRGEDVPSSRLAGVSPADSNGKREQDALATRGRDALATPGTVADKDFLKVALNPKKIDFMAVAWPSDKPAAAAKTGDDARPAMLPLATPMSITGHSDKARQDLVSMLRPMGIMPVQGGGVGGVDAKEAAKAKLVPGGAVAISLVTGDADVSAVGTVTEVIDDKVLMFGHMFFALGDVSTFPMGPAYVHTIVSGYQESFKLASALDPVGTLVTDETTGVSGRIGAESPMIPVTVNVLWKKDNRRQAYNYKVARNPRLTPVGIRYCLKDAATGWHEFPELHTLRYNVEIDYGKLGVFRSANVSSGSDIMEPLSDVTRPVMAMLRNPYGPPVEPKGVKIDLAIDEGQPLAKIVRLDLAGKIYRPGDLVEGTAVVQPFRQEEKEIAVKLKLPDDLPEGSYTINACDAESSIADLQASMPHRFAPKTVPELFDALRGIVAPQSDNLYLCLPLTSGGLAIGQKELPELPDSKARMIREARLSNTKTFSQTLFRTQASPYVLTGSATATITVQKEPQKTLLRP